jgi:hypothetical protein
MPINFTCPCGQALVAESQFVGMPVQCPKCNQQVTIPSETEPAASPNPSDSARPWEHSTSSAPSQSRQAANNSSGSFEGGILNGGAIGGILAMIGAVVWFVAGLAADVIFFYPPILFIIGLVAFFKGLAQGSGGSRD